MKANSVNKIFILIYWPRRTDLFKTSKSSQPTQVQFSKFSSM